MARICMNSTTTQYCNIVEELKIAKEAGYDAVEIHYNKIYRFLEEGYSLDALRPLLDGLEVASIGPLQEIERQGEQQKEYLAEMEKACALGEKLGAGLLQVCTGPGDFQTCYDFAQGKIGPDDNRYLGLLGEPEEVVIEKTAENLALGAKIAKEHGIRIYVEPCAWTPLAKISQILKAIKLSGTDNVGVVIDFWHLWMMGETPEYVASLDKNQILMIHATDGLIWDGKGAMNQNALRNCWTGEGDLPLKQYMDAVKATGYDGWYSTEILSSRIWERDPRETARMMKTTYEQMLGIGL